MKRQTLWVMLAALCLALMPRLATGDDFNTADEAAFWFQRSKAFGNALARGDLQDTWQAPHPGVTTMWAGVAGHAGYAVVSGDRGWPKTGKAGERLRWWARLAVSLTTAASIALAAGLLVSLRGVPTALAAALLLAGDTFFSAHSRILHNDALNAGFLLLAVLLAAWALQREGRDRRLALAAAAAAAALSTLSKMSGVVGFLVIGVAGVVVVAHSAWTGSRTRAEAWREIAVSAGIVAGVGLATTVLVWPVMWYDPMTVVHGMQEALSLSGAAHERGNFFAGRIVPDPGPAFYPVALAFRATVLTSLGVLLAGRSLLRRDPLAWLLTGSVLLFVLLLSMQGKKFDRYALAAMPLLDVLAAIGLVGVVELVAARWFAGRERGAWAAAGVVGALTAGVPAALANPYEITWYNPLLGGTPVARDWLLLGWGEGLSEAARWIDTQGGCRDDVQVYYHQCTRPYTCTRVHGMRWRGQEDWMVGYVNQIQRDMHHDQLAPYLEREPDHVVRIHGVEMVWVWRAIEPDTP